MNEVFVLDEVFQIEGALHELNSIAIEHRYDVDGSSCSGEFIISGDYREHEISVQKQNFSFKLPFANEVRSNVNLDSIEVEITDFTYELDGNDLNVHVEYALSGEQAAIEFAEESDLDDFLQQNNVEVVDLTEREEDEKLDITPLPEEIIEPAEDEREDEPERDHQSEIINKEEMIASINSEENYVTYHVHTITTNDSFETISNQYNISITELKRINNVEELTLGMKLIIPDEED